MTGHTPWRTVKTAVAMAKIARTERPYFVCPGCYTFTAHPDDVANSYCGHCHQFKFEILEDVRCFELTCADFGDRNFGDGTCPSEHAVPPAKRGHRVTTRAEDCPVCRQRYGQPAAEPCPMHGQADQSGITG